VENAAFIISIGGLGTDFNTGNFSYNIPTEKLVEVRFQNAASNFALIMILAPLKPHKSPIREI
jgi:pyruvate decarboxylase